MDIHSYFQRVVVCGHRWINAYYRDWYISGACYWSTISENETEALLPLVNRGRYTYIHSHRARSVEYTFCKYFTDKYVFNNQIYNYAMGQVGMAVHLPTDSVAISQFELNLLKWLFIILRYVLEQTRIITRSTGYFQLGRFTNIVQRFRSRTIRINQTFHRSDAF